MSTVEVANLFQVPQLNLPPRKKAIFLLLFNWRHLTFNAFMIYVHHVLETNSCVKTSNANVTKGQLRDITF
jgi:hypothetical protein